MKVGVVLGVELILSNGINKRINQRTNNKQSP